jgi:predicted GNAT family acetyltransferase
VADCSEIVAVATLPAYRRRGLGSTVTSTLVEHAFGSGVDLVLLSAQNDDVARIYEKLGFARIGAVGAAEPGHTGPSSA